MGGKRSAPPVRPSLLRGLIAAVVSLLLVAPAAWAQEPPGSTLGPPFPEGPPCPPRPPSGDRICSGQVESFDGTSLDVDLTQPAKDTGEKHPLIVMLHGFGNNKHEWESTTDEGDGADKRNWNSHWFAKHGYYVLTYTARGFRDPGPNEDHQPPTGSGSSAFPESGPRAKIHLKSRETEIKDTQWLAAVMAGSFRDIDPNKVAVTGGSYGGGESWLQASQATWSFPHQCSLDQASCSLPEGVQRPEVPEELPKLKLQAAIPKYPWTDLAYSLAPNGHPGPWPLQDVSDAERQPPSPPDPPKGYCDEDQSLTDDPCYSSSQGHPESDKGAGNPIGVNRFSYTNVFYAGGRDPTQGGTFQEEDPCDNPFAPDPLPQAFVGKPAPVDAWYQDLVVAPGDPYDIAGVDRPPWAPQIRHGLTECRGSFYQDKGWKAQDEGPRRVAIFSIEGWTDDLFTAVESFRQFKYLKSLNRRWPVEVALADVGHPRAKNNPDTWLYLNQQAWQWLQSHINGSQDRETPVTSEQTVCTDRTGEEEAPRDPDPNQSLTAATPEELSRGKLSVTYQPGRPITSDDVDLNGPLTDPIVDEATRVLSDTSNCPPSAGPAPYTGVSPPIPSDKTYVGLGSVTVPYQLATVPGPQQFAQLNARLWDVAPGQSGTEDCREEEAQPPQGCPRLISRGTYRISVPYDEQAGEIRIPLAGNHYKFRVGHKLRIDLTQVDDPYMRRQTPANTSTITFTGAPVLNLPTRQSGTTELTEPDNS